MAEKRKRPYEVCPDCGAHLDHGERCDCSGEDKREEAIYGLGMRERGAGMRRLHEVPGRAAGTLPMLWQRGL